MAEESSGGKEARPITPEQRFVELMGFAAPDAESAQEVSIPRKARRLDVVVRFERAPAWFGPLQEVCCDRVVLFEHVSRPVDRDGVLSAWFGVGWLAWERVRARGGNARVPSPWGAAAAPALPPVAVVVADGVRGDLSGVVPTLRAASVPGVWSTEALSEGGLVVIDTTKVRAEDGYGGWSWLGRTRTHEDGAERFMRLIDDERFPIVERERLKEAAMQGRIPVTDTERESLYQRLQREIREGHEAGLARGIGRGIERGLERGIERGRRQGLLRLVERLAPDALPTLTAIEDVEELEEAVMERLERGRAE